MQSTFYEKIIVNNFCLQRLVTVAEDAYAKHTYDAELEVCVVMLSIG